MTKPRTVLLGYEIGTGEPVNIPIRHMVVTGITQASGKTTTLEALVSRSGLAAIAFVTKRGEGSFRNARMIRPYFRERADWQFIAAVLEATMREKMRFERPWIMRATKGARTLADVQRNVKDAMKTAKGMSADIYMTLDNYLDIVAPQVATLDYTDSVDIRPGINVMDLSDYSTELQSLVIRSVLEFVYEHGRDTLVIIPEAWEFIPNNRNSPVLMACEQLIRKGANLRNFIWLDSQDITGVHTSIRRQVTVWIMGVQREANEVKRSLAHIPGGIRKPKVDDIMGLGLGQFYACFDREVRHTYVVPEWMSANDGRMTAISGHDGHSTEPPPPKPKGDTVDEREAARLRNENADLKRRVDDQATTIAELQRRVSLLAPPTVEFDRDRSAVKMTGGGGGGGKETAELKDNLVFSDELYQAIRARLLAEPAVVAAIAHTVSEIEVRVERKTVQIDGSSLKGRIARLLADGFYDDGATNSATRTELKRTGADANNANIGRVLAELQRDGFLTLEAGDRFKAVRGMKVNIVEA